MISLVILAVLFVAFMFYVTIRVYRMPAGSEEEIFPEEPAGVTGSYQAESPVKKMSLGAEAEKVLRIPYTINDKQLEMVVDTALGSAGVEMRIEGRVSRAQMVEDRNFLVSEVKRLTQGSSPME